MSSGRRFVIDDVRVFDGRRVLEHASVAVGGGFIEDVRDPGRCDVAPVVVDGRGGTLLPGLIDAHVHAEPGRLEQALVFGVTTEIDLFNDPAVAAALRRDAATRDDIADFRSAGTGATAPGGHPAMAVAEGRVPAFPSVRGPEDAAGFVADRVAEGSNLLKIFVEPGLSVGAPMPALDADTVAALTTAARRHGLTSVAHCTDVASALLAIGSGVDGLAHVPCDRHDTSIVEFARQRGVFVIPTLVMLQTLCGDSTAARLLDDPWVRPLLDGVSRQTLAARWPLGDAGQRDYTAAAALVRELHRAGVPLLAGSDAVNPGTAHGASLHHELELLVEAGLAPTEALTSATSTPAQLLGLDDRGEIVAGKRADLVLVDGDPTRDITASRHIRAVWRGGVNAPRTATSL